MTAIVVVGDLMVDVVARLREPLRTGSDAAARIVYRDGGSAANVAAWLARLGHPPRLVCRIGDDDAGQGAVGRLREQGVEVHAAVDPELATGTCVVLVDPDGGERTMVPDRGANARLAPTDLPADLVAEGDHLHLSGYVLLHPGSRAAGTAALARARALHATTSLDPASAGPLAALGAGAFAALVGRVDTLLPNRDEAAVLDAGAAQLAAEVVTTLGPDGARWSDGRRTITRSAGAVGVRDVTGAGDAFTAGWLAARRLEGCSPEEALDRAQAVAAEAIALPGARPS